jgi:hypothetical protein
MFRREMLQVDSDEEEDQLLAMQVRRCSEREREEMHAAALS